MVAISLYRGNLHRVSDAPRRWPMPPQSISLSQFKLLTRKRSEALSRLSPQNPNPEKKNDEEKGKEEEEEEEEGMGDKGTQPPKPETASIPPQPNNSEDSKEGKPIQDTKGIDASALNPPAGAPAASEEVRNSEIGGGGTADVKMEVSNNLDTVCDKEKRKRELEKKLQVLNEKKHHLVQMLKQILNAEEEIKRRNAQSAALRSSIPLQAETVVDMGSVTRHVPKLSVEVNCGGDLGGESDASANHNAHGRQMHHMHSTSPSAASLTRPFHGSFQQNALLPTPRTSLLTVGHSQTPSNVLMGSGAAAAAASPSRFAPTGHQGHHHSASLPPVSIPGTHFMASSPSPAASGGASSVFRDSRLTSSS